MRNVVGRDFVHVFQMSAQVSALRKLLLALWARERPQTSVLTEVIAQIAALFEDGAAAPVTAPEVKLDAPARSVSHLNCLVPVAWHASEKFRGAKSPIFIIFCNGVFFW